ncbi:LysR family transcriptional regulator [Pikeienuella piscinae]|uniref:LysR family transcriptional regulator n=1 Tax=Pikeienuella piscinae TaxID=2748098 RepID=A0A7L5BUG0_9RHOB|nr:LysR family transcriptional regulator [Pikeienuella piscinae]QIE55252.1 LysR family transcriptional regulator [Pikeienuella piscinae]
MHAENWDDLRIFRAVAERRGFIAAARMLGISRHVIRRRVGALEGVLGARLLERRGRWLRLTEAGRDALDHADEMAAVWDAALLGVAGPSGEAGSVRIAAPEGLASWLLAPFAESFEARHVRLLFVGADAAGSAADITLAFRPGPFARRIGRIEYRVYAAPWTDRQTPFGPFWIEQGPPGSDLREWLDDAPAASGWARAEAEDEASALALIRSGAGRGWLPTPLAMREPGIEPRDMELTRKRDLWMEIAGKSKRLTRVMLAADWIMERTKAAMKLRR